MKYNLPALISAGRRSRRGEGITLRAIEVPAILERELLAITIQPVNYWGVELREAILPLLNKELDAREFFGDDASDSLSAAIGAASDNASRLVLTLTPLLEQYIVRLERWHRNRWVGRVQSGARFDVSAFVADMSASAEVRAHQQWASGLIRDISDDMRRRIEAAVFRTVSGSMSRRDLAKQVREIMAIGRHRARFIARDQANKIAGKLDELRHREAGIGKYRWETARDDRVRPTHRANQGKVFSWENPPAATGHPRTEPNCRCRAQAWIPAVEQADPARTEAEVFGAA